MPSNVRNNPGELVAESKYLRSKSDKKPFWYHAVRVISKDVAMLRFKVRRFRQTYGVIIADVTVNRKAPSFTKSSATSLKRLPVHTNRPNQIAKGQRPQWWYKEQNEEAKREG